MLRRTMSSILPNSLSVLRHEQVKKNSTSTAVTTDDSMQALTRSLMLVKKIDKKFPVFQQSFIIGSLLEQLCSLYETDEDKSKALYRALCEQLARWNIISPVTYLEEFTSVQTQYRNALFNIIQSSLTTINVDSSRLPTMLRSMGDTPNFMGPTAINKEEVFNFKTSRYTREFTELGKLGKGGYGNVFRAESKIDGQEYAVKKVPLRSSLLNELNEALLREVKVLASLRHKNIVQYHSAWIEHENESDVSDVEDDESLDSGKLVPFSNKQDLFAEPNITSSDEDIVVFDEITSGEFGAFRGCNVEQDSSVAASQQENATAPMLSKFWGDSSISEPTTTQETKSCDVHFQISSSESEGEIGFDNCSSVDKSQNMAQSLSPPKEVIFTHGVRRDLELHKVKSFIISRSAGNSTSSDVIKHPRNHSFSTIARNDFSADCGVADKLLKLTRPSNAHSKMVLYMQMQLCEMSLKQWLLVRNKSISNGKAFFHESTPYHIMKQVASALHFIHSKDLIHRDVKPPNIFLNNPENPYIMLGDFGLAKNSIGIPYNLSKHESRGLRRLGSHTSGVGTATYAAPEQLIADIYDAKVDMYSFGIVIYELWTPFSTSMERARQINLLRSHRIPRDFTEKYFELGKLVTRLLDHNPELRPSSSDLLKHDFFDKSKDRVIEDQRLAILELEKEIDQLKLEQKRLLAALNDRTVRTSPPSSL